ncbi:MAG TPA: sulfatase-like hydrolase/transferase [Candidatus Saccharicenans sp.]|nr:sulfatase-like hydrolase/transferase [Candidatus Saccharicenans sp.]HQO75617.1 sulfatase-like hydrolase/transferase [Candidatus Saccharicenans sp.]HUM79401.1 sulfatase-like hydrolase/transferase [Candidatus Saccharicenans sp.]
MSKKKKQKKKIRLENKSNRCPIAGENKEQPKKGEAQASGKAKKTRISPWIIVGLILLLAGLGALIRFRSPSLDLKTAPSYNLLLITLDTTRADHLGCYGNKQARTPNLDRLAAEGWRFNRVYCSAPLTLPSHATILTGLEPVAHGVRNNGHYLAAGIKTITEVLVDRGYKTAAFVSSFSVDSRFGLDRGFESYDDTFEENLPFKTNNAERRAEATFARFSAWLEKNYQNKFFSWVHYFDPHLPYDPPSPYKEDFASQPYDGEIAYMDFYVGKIVEALQAKGLLDKTIIIIAGDHGEGLGDKVEKGHGLFLYEETVRVPLIIWNKKIFPKPGTANETVRLLDIAPTILELCGAEVSQLPVQGKSLLPIMEKKERKDRTALIETFYPRENFGWSELVALVEDRWKYIQCPRPELYDLKADPEERKNLFDSSPEITARLKKQLESDLLLAGGQGINRPSGSSGPTAADTEKLRSLGYLSFAPARASSTFPDPKEKIDLLNLIQQAQAAEYQENYAEAEQLYLKILAEVPDSPASYVNLAIAQARQRKMEEAIETLKKGLKRLSDSEILLVRLGHTYLVSGKLSEAFSTMNQVLKLNPRNVDALTVCAGILDTSGRKEEAQKYYEQALAIEPESKYLRMSYAGSLASSGKLREAIEIYKKLIDDYPGDQAFYQFIGIAYSYLGEHDEAIFYLKQAIAISPTRSGYFNLAVACQKAGLAREAIEYYKLYLENSKGDNPANIRLAQGELEKLEKQLTEN